MKLSPSNKTHGKKALPLLKIHIVGYNISNTHMDNWHGAAEYSMVFTLLQAKYLRCSCEPFESKNVIFLCP